MTVIHQPFRQPGTPGAKSRYLFNKLAVGDTLIIDAMRIPVSAHSLYCCVLRFQKKNNVSLTIEDAGSHYIVKRIA